MIDHSEADVWALLERHRIRSHPAYLLGFSRVSCMPCIFGMADQWATVRDLDGARFAKMSAYEERFGVTLKRGTTLETMAAAGQSFAPRAAELRQLALSHRYSEPALLADGEPWQQPAGAFRRQGGPI